MCAYSVFNTFPVYPLSAKPLILLAFCRYRYHTSLFDRPGWNEMIGLSEAGKVKTVIVKDMSRMGRDYLKVGYYTESFFAERDIRYIAINDGVDSDKGDNDFTPFRNLFNDNLE
nr:recombinase family protein [Anaeromassilibacillus sp. Marseille-P3371]